mgnify:CR=1 FL=1
MFRFHVLVAGAHHRAAALPRHQVPLPLQVEQRDIAAKDFRVVGREMRPAPSLRWRPRRDR